MSWYRVSAMVTVSAEVWVEAPSREVALEKARRCPVELTPLGADRHGVDPTETFCVEAADGIPTSLRVEQVGYDSLPDEVKAAAEEEEVEEEDEAP